MFLFRQTQFVLIMILRASLKPKMRFSNTFRSGFRVLTLIYFSTLFGMSLREKIILTR